jgi:hypothetical protein
MLLRRKRIKAEINRVKIFYISWFFITAYILIPGAAAQENFEGRIFYAHGTEFILFREGMGEIYGPGALNSSEISLGNGDIIQTGPESFLEFQFLPDGTGIKVAENTYIQINWQVDGLPVITISYGSIRVVTGLQAPSPALYVQGGDGIAGVQNGDFCFDYMIASFDSQSDGIIEPRFQMYGFRGLSEVAIANTAGMESSSQSDWPGILVNEGESVSLEVNASLAMVERKPLDREVIGYWERNNFRGTPPLPLPDTTLAAGTGAKASRAQQVPASEPKYDFTASQRRLTLIKNILIISGLTLTVTGVAAQAIGYAVLNPTDPALAQKQVNFGFIPVGIGISAIIAALFFNPAFP